MKNSSKQINSFCPKNKKEWRTWLEKNHESEDNVWLIMYKKSSDNHNISWSDAVDEGLCFGWIDSLKKKVDDESAKQYFSKRKKNGTWSKVNKEKVDVLIENKLMTPAGLKTIEVAKQNGSWIILDDVDALVLPANLSLEFKKHPGALEYYEGLSKSGKKLLLSWIALAKRPETKQNRIIEIAENAGKQQKPKPFR
jgi:uncharacterized protein YdeI (YjbR/CyaY-like superfamily)